MIGPSTLMLGSRTFATTTWCASQKSMTELSLTLSSPWTQCRQHCLTWTQMHIKTFWLFSSVSLQNWFCAPISGLWPCVNSLLVGVHDFMVVWVCSAPCSGLAACSPDSSRHVHVLQWNTVFIRWLFLQEHVNHYNDLFTVYDIQKEKHLNDVSTSRHNLLSSLVSFHNAFSVEATLTSINSHIAVAVV